MVFRNKRPIFFAIIGMTFNFTVVVNRRRRRRVNHLHYFQNNIYYIILYFKHYQLFLGGIDEAGRGSIIGPLVIAGISFDSRKLDLLKNMNITDSKKINPKKREILF